MLFAQNKMNKLFQQALDDLDDENYPQALAKARLMREKRFSGAFEIEARVWLAQGEPERALEVLVESPPEVFSLQLLTATTLSELGRYEQAHCAYERARRCPGKELESLDYHQAITLMLEGRFAEALDLCPQSQDPDFLSLRVTLLTRKGDFLEAARLARAFREPDRNAACCRALALEAWHLRGRREEAVDWAERALSLEGHDELSLQLISQLLTCSSRRFRLVIRGIWNQRQNGFIPHFFRVFQVEASSPQEALERASLEEPEAVRASLAVEECDDLGAYPPGRGVFGRSGHIFFPPD